MPTGVPNEFILINHEVMEEEYRYEGLFAPD